jgi:hypothetical protein
VIALELTENWSTELKTKVSEYFAKERIEVRDVLRVDLVLALLRIGTPDAMERVPELTGKAITRCPSGVPPWPPKPVASFPHAPR